MTPAQIMRAAASVVRRGWCRYTRDNGRGAHCALGALDVVVRRERSGDHYVDSTDIPRLMVEALRAQAEAPDPT